MTQGGPPSIIGGYTGRERTERICSEYTGSSGCENKVGQLQASFNEEDQKGPTTDPAKSALMRTGRANIRLRSGKARKVALVRPDFLQGPKASNIEVMASAMCDLAGASKTIRPRPPVAVEGRVELHQMQHQESQIDEDGLHLGAQGSDRLHASHQQETRARRSCAFEGAIAGFGASVVDGHVQDALEI